MSARRAKLKIAPNIVPRGSSLSKSSENTPSDARTQQVPPAEPQRVPTPVTPQQQDATANRSENDSVSVASFASDVSVPSDIDRVLEMRQNAAILKIKAEMQPEVDSQTSASQRRLATKVVPLLNVRRKPQPETAKDKFKNLSKAIHGIGTLSTLQESKAVNAAIRDQFPLQVTIAELKEENIDQGSPDVEHIIQERVNKMRKRVRTKQAKPPPDPDKMTMFDLIYWNPKSNPMTKIEPPEEVEEQIVQPPPEIENQEPNDAEPVPQVKIGADGQIVLDEKSLLIETTDSKMAKITETKTVHERASQATYSSFKNKRGGGTRNVWTDRETKKFYHALCTVGTDFSMMLEMFPTRSRHDLKLKFKKEERNNRGLVDRAIGGQLFDMSILDEWDNEVEPPRVKKPKVKKPRKPRKKQEKKPRKHAWELEENSDIEGEARVKPAGLRRMYKHRDDVRENQKALRFDVSQPLNCELESEDDGEPRRKRGRPRKVRNPEDESDVEQPKKKRKQKNGEKQVRKKKSGEEKVRKKKNGGNLGERNDSPDSGNLTGSQVTSSQSVANGSGGSQSELMAGIVASIPDMMEVPPHLLPPTMVVQPGRRYVCIRGDDPNVPGKQVLHFYTVSDKDTITVPSK